MVISFLEVLCPPRVLGKCCARISILYGKTIESVDTLSRQTYGFAPEIPCLVDFRDVFQFLLENDISWYQLSPDPLLFIKPLKLKSHEIGCIIQFPIFDTKRVKVCSPTKTKFLR